MAHAVRTQLIRIGNSRGVRLPKGILEQAGLERDVDIEVHDGAVVIRAAAHPRAGWAEAYADIATHGDDFILDADAPPLTRWDAEEREW
jgi:antitoxin MazE